MNQSSLNGPDHYIPKNIGLLKEKSSSTASPLKETRERHERELSLSLSHIMGNKIAKTTQVSASEYYLHDLPSSYNLVYIESLGHDRLFKSIRCKHDEGEVLVKVYFKRGDSLALKVFAISEFIIYHFFF